MASERSFYRTSATRWTFVVTGAFLTWAFSPVSPDSLRATPSLLWLHRTLPWPVFCAAFALYTLLHLADRITGVVVADGIGALMYLLEAIALLATTGQQVDGHYVSLSPFAFAAFALAFILHIAAARLALIEQESRR